MHTKLQRNNLVPRAFSSFKMTVGQTPGQGCRSGSKSSLEFRHANTMKCLRFVWTTVSDSRNQTGPPDTGNNVRKSHFIMCHVTKYSTILGVFQQPWPGVSPTAILNEEKALGTRLMPSLHCLKVEFSDTQSQDVAYCKLANQKEPLVFFQIREFCI